MLPVNWTDKNGFIKPRSAWTDSGNGITYTSLYLALCDANDGGTALTSASDFLTSILACRQKPGLYMRTPQNSYGQQQWDDYLGLVTFAIYAGQPELAKQIFWYGIRHFGFFNTDALLQWKDFLWRAIHVFFGLLPFAAFPSLRWASPPFLWLYSKTLNATDPNGIFLDWMWFYGAKKLGYTSPKYAVRSQQLVAALQNQLDADHPCTALAKGLK